MNSNIIQLLNRFKATSN